MTRQTIRKSGRNPRHGHNFSLCTVRDGVVTHLERIPEAADTLEIDGLPPEDSVGEATEGT